MLIIFENNDPELEQHYQLWRETSDKPLSWEKPPFELEISLISRGEGRGRSDGFVLFAWKRQRLSFRGEDFLYYQLEYCSGIHFWQRSKRMTLDDLSKRYRSGNHANARWFSLICQAHEAWYEAEKPETFRFIA